MSDTMPPVPNFQPITEEQLQKISGGECTATDITKLLENLRDNYDTLIDFTSYVIERVVGPAT